jgi:hypothetical protein
MITAFLLLWLSAWNVGPGSMEPQVLHPLCLCACVCVYNTVTAKTNFPHAHLCSGGLRHCRTTYNLVLLQRTTLFPLTSWNVEPHTHIQKFRHTQTVHTSPNLSDVYLRREGLGAVWGSMEPSRWAGSLTHTAQDPAQPTANIHYSSLHLTLAPGSQTLLFVHREEFQGLIRQYSGFLIWILKRGEWTYALSQGDLLFV